MNDVKDGVAASKEATGAPEREDSEIDITPEMIKAGIKALEAGLIDDCSLRGFRRELVGEIFVSMLRVAK